MTDKWGEIQGKSDLVRVSGEFELSEFELSGFYCIYIYVISYPHGFLKAFVGTHRRERLRLDKSIFWTLVKHF